MMVEVSVLMAVRNAADTVECAVRSIEAQSFTHWELVVVDDGSTDETREVLARFAERNPRIRLFCRSFQGIAAALNTGLKLCRAPYIARMDADDESLPERLSRQYRFLERHPELGMIATCVAYGGDRALQAGYGQYVDWSNRLVVEETIALSRFVESPFVHPSVMFRHSLIDAWGGYSTEDEPEDYELWLRWYSKGVRMGKLKDVLYIWNDPPQRLSRVAPQYSVEAFSKCKARYIAQWLRGNKLDIRALYVWGAGRITRKRVDWLVRQGLIIQGFVDVDPKKIGQQIAGVPVLSPDALPPPGAVFVLSYVSSRGAPKRVKDYLVNERGYVEGVDFLMAG